MKYMVWSRMRWYDYSNTSLKLQGLCLLTKISSILVLVHCFCSLYLSSWEGCSVFWGKGMCDFYLFVTPVLHLNAEVLSLFGSQLCP